MKRWNESRRFCSVSCSKKGNKNRLGISYPAWNKGKPGPRGSANSNWRGGPKNTRDLRQTYEYKAWRTAIFERDDYTCQICDTKGGMLNADHIKRFSEYPELRFDMSNGRTLCIECHRGTPTYGSRKLVVTN